MDEMVIGKAAREFEEMQGQTPSAYAFQEGAKWQNRHHRFARFTNEECWIYQGDGYDHLESLTCPVVISAKELMQLIANQQLQRASR